MTTKKMRVRYCPSPTGLQHIGGIRTALFNYFFAKANGGDFILRIEDTDRERFNDESLQDLYDSLNFLGVEWSEGPDKDGGVGPYVQSERLEIYDKYIKELVSSGKAYHCFCTSERLDSLRETQGEETGYDRACRDLDANEVVSRLSAGEKSVIRLRLPEDGKIEFIDAILGRIRRKNKDVSPDPVIMKSDGYPTYHFANVIDDHLMGITHVLRGQEWIPTTPIHILLYKAFGWEHPVFAHLPMIMGKDGKKLSKRHGSTFFNQFVKDGYLPEALINYIMMLGWSHDGEKEFFSHDELSEFFSLEKINKAPAKFDYKKLDWYNGNYIRSSSDERIKSLVDAELKSLDVEVDYSKLFSCLKERLKKIADAPIMLRFLFDDKEPDVKDLIPKGLGAEDALHILTILKDSSPDAFEDLARSIATEKKIGLGKVIQPFRVSLTGSTTSLPIVDVLTSFDKEKVEKKILASINALRKLM